MYKDLVPNSSHRLEIWSLEVTKEKSSHGEPMGIKTLKRDCRIEMQIIHSE